MSYLTYKYLSPERITYLDDQLLRFTPPGDLNDPFECMPSMEDEDVAEVVRQFQSEELKAINHNLSYSRAKKKEELRRIKYIHAEKIKILKSDPDELKNNVFDEMKKGLNSRIGILSLSQRWNSTLMWSHYCSGHRGYCIGFDKSHSFFSTQGPVYKTAIREVSYSDLRIRVSTAAEKLVGIEVMYVKSKDWDYEKEERILTVLDLAEKVIDSNPYPIHLFKVDQEAISEIIIGVNASFDLKERIMVFCKMHKIKCFESVISKVKFDMERTEILL